MDPVTFASFVMACAPLVDLGTARALVKVESDFNPHAIGVVAGALARKPGSRAEALATTRSLQAGGWNYSVGLAQINVHNFQRVGLTNDSAFDPCANLAAMQALLVDCYGRVASNNLPQRALRQALSCYYSGNPRTGFIHGYVQRVLRAAAATSSSPPPKEIS